MDTSSTIYIQFERFAKIFWYGCSVFDGSDVIAACVDGDMVAIDSSSPINVKIVIMSCLEQLEITLIPGNVYYINKIKKMNGQSAKVSLDRTILLTESNISLVESVKQVFSAKPKGKVSTLDFVPTKSIMVDGGFVGEVPVVDFDDKRKQWRVAPYNDGVYNYSDILNFELIEDGESIVSGGVGRALIGGALFGGVGAVVGAVTGKKRSKSVCTNMQIKVTVKDIKNPVVYIVFCSDPRGLRKDDGKYEKLFTSAHECISIFQLICESQESVVKTPSSGYVSSADEIMKYKDLLDKGAITTDEYEAKKKQLLNL